MIGNNEESISVAITEVENKGDILDNNESDVDMTGMSTKFLEVAISLQPASETISDGNSGKFDEENANDLSSQKSFFTPQSWNIVNRVKNLPRIISKNNLRRNSASSYMSTDSCYYDSKTDDETGKRFHIRKVSLTPSQINLAAIAKPFSQMKKVIPSTTKLQKNNFGNKSPLSERRSGGESSKQISFQKRIDRWTISLQKGLLEDINGNNQAAYDIYRKFNIQVTKESIAKFEQFTHDQQKLMNQLMNKLDKRCSKIKHPANANTKNDLDNDDGDTTLSDLRQALGLLSTIKAIGSTKPISVMLVYQEKKHRKKHRDEQKGKSNKIVFAKEKRDFLQVMGLPESMITSQGLDFSVMPSTTPEPGSTIKSDLINGAESNDSFATVTQFTTPERRAEPDITTVPSNNIDSNKFDSNVVPEEDDSKLSLINRCLKFRKRFTRVPADPDFDEYENNYKPSNTLSVEEWLDEEISRTNKKDSVSMLSCESCSSSESIDSDYEMETDTAVLANYIHQEIILPPPLHTASETYLEFVFEKIGLKNSNILSPFLRVSLRDNYGNLIVDEQETSCWEVVNTNYLRGPSAVFLQESLESLPHDLNIFFEIRHFVPSKRKVSTHSYTYLERSELQNGEFICEMFKPPVDFSKTKIIPYSEKALFLHLQIRFSNGEVEEEEEEDLGDEIWEELEEEFN